MKTRIITLTLASQIILSGSALGSPQAYFPAYSPNDPIEIVENGGIPSEEYTNPASEPTRSSLRRYTRLAIGTCCLGAAAATAYGCYLASAEAHHLDNEIESAREPVLGASQQIRILCRTSETWKAACSSLDSKACENSDDYRTQGNLYSEVKWIIGNCGQWERLTVSEYEREYDCDRKCTHKCDSQGNNCKPHCQNHCEWDTDLIRQKDLSSLFNQCPNHADYQQLVNSDQFNKCTVVIDKNKGRACGYVTAAVFSALGAAAFAGCGIMALVCAL